MSAILVTGGAGYIGSHVTAALLAAGYDDVIVLDDLSNASASSISRVNTLSDGAARLIEGDCRDQGLLDTIFTQNTVSGVIHLAGLKAVGESVAQPERYYDVNLGTAISLIRQMLRHRVGRLVFSSSATVYGDAAVMPLVETMTTKATNPYGQTKLMIEHMLADVARAHDWFQAISLRYFNPAGAHPSGLIGDDPRGIPNNLFPLIAKVAVGQMDQISVFGMDWPTPDGTGVRDYIHVMDLAEGHVAALEAQQDGLALGQHEVINLGSGTGTSVLDAVTCFAAESGQAVPYQIDDRRPGDVAVLVADATRASDLLGWTAQRDFRQICRDHWAWQSGAAGRGLDD